MKNVRKMNLYEVARYLSGEDSCHNHPTICAHGCGFLVTTKLGQREFTSDQLDEAFSFFRMMLEEIGYVQV